jgi:hypothetical protein
MSIFCQSTKVCCTEILLKSDWHEEGNHSFKKLVKSTFLLGLVCKIDGKLATHNTQTVFEASWSKSAESYKVTLKICLSFLPENGSCNDVQYLSDLQHINAAQTNEPH